MVNYSFVAGDSTQKGNCSILGTVAFCALNDVVKVELHVTFTFNQTVYKTMSFYDLLLFFH